MELKQFKTIPLLIIWSILVTVSHAGETCHYVEDGYVYQMYCSSGCCGGLYNAYCCWSAGIIVGIVVGAICLIAFIAIVVMCVYHYKTKQRRQVRTVTVTSVEPRATAVVVPPPYTGYAPPPGYESQRASLSSSQDPAYPPPPAYQVQAWGTAPFSVMPYMPPPAYPNPGGPHAAGGVYTQQQLPPGYQNMTTAGPTSGPPNPNPFSSAAVNSVQVSHGSSNGGIPPPSAPAMATTTTTNNNNELPVLNLRTGGRVSLPPINTTPAET